MRVRLRRSWINAQGRKYPVGTVLQVFDGYGKKLIEEGYGYKYDGEYPPKKEKITLNNLNNDSKRKQNRRLR